MFALGGGIDKGSCCWPLMAGLGPGALDSDLAPLRPYLARNVDCPTDPDKQQGEATPCAKDGENPAIDRQSACASVFIPDVSREAVLFELVVEHFPGTFAAPEPK